MRGDVERLEEVVGFVICICNWPWNGHYMFTALHGAPRGAQPAYLTDNFLGKRDVMLAFGVLPIGNVHSLPNWFQATASTSFLQLSQMELLPSLFSCRVVVLG